MKKLSLVNLSTKEDVGYLYDALYYIAEEIEDVSGLNANKNGLFVLITDYRKKNITRLAEICDTVWSIKLNPSILSQNMGLEKQLYIIIVEYGDLLLGKYIDLVDKDGINKLLHRIYKICGRDFENLPY